MKTSLFRAVVAATTWILSLGYAHAGAPTIPVRVGVLEALAEMKTSPSLRYKEHYQAALFYAIGETDRKINQCGYHWEIAEKYFDPEDIPAAGKLAKEHLEQGAWIVFSPRRSDHFRVVTQMSGSLPVISPMATATQIQNLPPPVFSMAEGSLELTRAALQELKQAKYPTDYVTILDATCPACRDFSEVFDQETKTKLTKLHQIEVAGETPDLTQVMAALERKEPGFVLIPNFSELSAYLIIKIHERFPKIRFVGSDGWGDGVVGYFNNYGFKPNVKGFCVRGGASAEALADRFKVYSLDRRWSNEKASPPTSAFYVISFFRKLANDLCAAKPRNSQDLAAYYRRQSTRHFRMEYGISVYEFKDSKLAYKRTLPLAGAKR